MLTEYISDVPDAKVVVLFGGNPLRRDEVVNLVKDMGSLTVYGTLDEEEGMARIESLPKVDLIIIGGRYTEEQRLRIKSFAFHHMPGTRPSEPGWEYPYQNEAIKTDIKLKLNIR
jgi:hypothetical protein